MNQTPAHPLTFCDVSMFYCEQGGGIRTYHRAKLEWFANQSAHRYVLVYPGPRFRITHPCPTVTLVEVYGCTTGRGADGYRLMLDYRHVRRTLATFRPHVVEAGDPWVSGPFALMARYGGHHTGLVTSFYHTDSLGAYVTPWIQRRRWPGPMRSAVQGAAARIFWRLQRLYDATLVSSAEMKRQLASEGVPDVIVAPFGLDPGILHHPPRRASVGRPARLLYAGRLQPEKGFDLVLDLVDELVAPPHVHLTVVGTGPLASHVASLGHPGVRYEGYVADRARMQELYRTHDVLLSPSATETFGLTTLEAMAAGLVVVGANGGGVGDLMRQAGSPFAFRAGDRQGFLEATRGAIEADRRGLARAARDVAERHGTWGDAVDRQVRLYGEWLASSRHIVRAEPRRLLALAAGDNVLTLPQRPRDDVDTLRR